MKKIFSLAIFCLCLVGVYGQESQIPDGIYMLEKAELTITNYDTKGVVEHKVITDKESIDIQNMHLANIFIALDFMNGELQECVMADGQKYRLDETMKLQPAMEKSEQTLAKMEESRSDYLFIEKELFPYLIKVEANKLIVTFAKYNFGQTEVNYTMEAELVENMVKQKDR